MGRLELDKWSVEKLHGLYRKGRLNTRPSWQRSKVWNDRMKQALVDTIIQNLPLGLVMLNVESAMDEDKNPIEKYDVVDGQQRLTTLFDYVEGASWAAPKKSRTISPYKSLTASQQQRFDEYNVPVALMRDWKKSCSTVSADCKTPSLSRLVNELRPCLASSIRL